jgi:RNA polymerase sigma-32 factor
MESRLSSHDMSFDGHDDDDDEGPSAPSTYLPDMSLEPASALEREDSSSYQRDRLFAALEGLDDRSKTILQERWLNEKKQTLHELAQQFSGRRQREERIRSADREERSMNKMRDFEHPRRSQAASKLD